MASSSNRLPQSPASSRDSSPPSTPRQSTVILSPTKKTTTAPAQQTVVQRKSPQEKKQTTQEFSKNISINSAPKSSTKDCYIRLSSKEVEDELAELIQIKGSRDARKYASIFEKVDTHDGHTTYLGSGTFSQLEDCICNCLARDKYCRETTYRSRKYDYSSKSLIRASLLDDYSYDGVISPDCHVSHSRNSHHYENRKRAAGELSLSEIRQVNDALAKHGISVFSSQPNPYNPHYPQRNVNDIISACRLLIEDPAIAGLNNRHTAVSHAWDAARFSPASHQPSPGGYATPAVQAVASHLFSPPYQPPYSPTQSVISRLFSGSQQHQPPPPPPPPQHYTAAPHNQYPGNYPYPY